MTRIAFKAETGYSKRQWAAKLRQLYDEAKKRHDGNSLSIYGRVTEMLDYLENVEQTPDSYDILGKLNDLAHDLHTA